MEDSPNTTVVRMPAWMRMGFTLAILILLAAFTYLGVGIVRGGSTAGGVVIVLVAGAFGGFNLATVLGSRICLTSDGLTVRFTLLDRGVFYRWAATGPFLVAGSLFGVIVFNGRPEFRSWACLLFMGSQTRSKRLFGFDNALATVFLGCSSSRLANLLNQWRERQHGV